MKAKFAASLLATLGLTALVVSALAQPQSVVDNPTRAPTVPVQPQYAPAAPAALNPYSQQVQPSHTPRYSAGATYSTSQGWGETTEEAGLAREAARLVQQLGEVKTDSDRDKLKTKLSETLEKQFDLRQRRHEGEIEALEAQVKRLRDLVQKRQENRREIVSKRLDQILREAQGLGW